MMRRLRSAGHLPQHPRPPRHHLPNLAGYLGPSMVRIILPFETIPHLGVVSLYLKGPTT